MNKRLVLLGFVVAGICLIRVFTIAAHAYDDVEVYSSLEGPAAREAADDDTRRSEIRLTRPGEASARIADHGYDMVPGIERLWKPDDKSHAISVPKKTGRAIAAAVSTTEIDLDASAPYPTAGALKAEVMEPRPAEVARSAPEAAKAQYGLASEPRFEPTVATVAPSSYARTGVQEVSLIVSDHGYYPSKIFVTENVPVKIYLTTTSKTTLCFIADVWGLKKGVAPGKVEEVEFVPDRPGEFRFYCPVKSIEGRIAVRESQLAEQSPRGLASEPMGELRAVVE